MTAKKNNQLAIVGQIVPQENKYYKRVSRVYLIVSFVMLVVLILMAVFSIIYFNEYITYANFRYLLRDFSSIDSFSESSYQNIVYNSGSDSDFKYYKNGISIINNGSYMYYDSTGKLLVNDQLSYTSPVSVSSNKYILVYDLDSYDYSIYNQLASVLNGKTEGKIIAADISDEGSYVIVSKSRKTRYVAELFNSSFKKILTVNKDNYVLDVCVSSDGKYIGIASAVYSGNDFYTELDICEKGKNESVAKIKIDNSIPLKIKKNENGFMVLCDNCMYMIDYGGNIISRREFRGYEIKLADFSEKYCLIVSSNDTLGYNNLVTVIDSLNGQTISEISYNGRITEVKASVIDAHFGYLLTRDSVITINSDNSLNPTKLETHISSIVAVKEGVVLCGENSTLLISD